jgi:hypothetical protein
MNGGGDWLQVVRDKRQKELMREERMFVLDVLKVIKH